MLQYLHNVMKLWRDTPGVFGAHTQGDYCKHLVLELCAMVMWTSSGGDIWWYLRMQSCPIVGNSILNSYWKWGFSFQGCRFLPNSWFLAPKMSLKCFLSQTQTLTTQTFVTSERHDPWWTWWTWKTSPSPVLNGGAGGGLKFLKASGMQHTMPGAFFVENSQQRMMVGIRGRNIGSTWDVWWFFVVIDSDC